MNTHELAQKLLEAPNVEVKVTYIEGELEGDTRWKETVHLTVRQFVPGFWPNRVGLKP